MNRGTPWGNLCEKPLVWEDRVSDAKNHPRQGANPGKSESAGEKAAVGERAEPEDQMCIGGLCFPAGLGDVDESDKREGG